VGADPRTMVSGALYRVRKDGECVSYEAAPVAGLRGRYSLTAEPISDGHGARTHVLITLSNADAQDAPPRAPLAAAAAPAPAAPVTAERAAESTEELRALEDELSYTKENLQAAIQELE